MLWKQANVSFAVITIQLIVKIFSFCLMSISMMVPMMSITVMTWVLVAIMIIMVTNVIKIVQVNSITVFIVPFNLCFVAVFVFVFISFNCMIWITSTVSRFPRVFIWNRCVSSEKRTRKKVNLLIIKLFLSTFCFCQLTESICHGSGLVRSDHHSDGYCNGCSQLKFSNQLKPRWLLGKMMMIVEH